MRDVVWTIIIIWVIYKLIDIFRSSGSKKTYAYEQNSNQNSSQNSQAEYTKKPNRHSGGDIKSAIHKSAEKEGEYVDFEELK